MVEFRMTIKEVISHVFQAFYSIVDWLSELTYRVYSFDFLNLTIGQAFFGQIIIGNAFIALNLLLDYNVTRQTKVICFILIFLFLYVFDWLNKYYVLNFLG